MRPNTKNLDLVELSSTSSALFTLLSLSQQTLPALLPISPHRGMPPPILPPISATSGPGNGQAAAHWHSTSANPAWARTEKAPVLGWCWGSMNMLYSDLELSAPEVRALNLLHRRHFGQCNVTDRLDRHWLCREVASWISLGKKCSKIRKEALRYVPLNLPRKETPETRPHPPNSKY